jgi:2',3'-cyclic-nucleotide 2'-phosphodiesterase (5'-nucleotidase family)
MNRLCWFGWMFLFGCKTVVSPPESTYAQIKIQGGEKNPEWLEPYKKKLDASMGQPIFRTASGMSKGLPVSKIGVFLSDLLLAGDSLNAQAILLNEGGIRSSFVAGQVNAGNLFEVLPFDNRMVLLELDSIDFISLLDVFAKKGGTPLAGLKWKIAGKKTQSVEFNRPLVNGKVRVWVNDYMAQGGDQCSMLIGKPWKAEGPFIRDAVLERIQKSIPSDSVVDVQVDQRIIVQQ